MKELIAVLIGVLIGFFAHGILVKQITVINSDGLNECYAKVYELDTRVKLYSSIIQDNVVQEGKMIVSNTLTNHQ